MTLPSVSRAVVIILCLSVWAAPAAGQPALTPAEQEAFLRTAKVVASRPIGKGVTRPMRLTLSNGQLTHDAAFQSIDEKRTLQTFDRNTKPQVNFVDAWRMNIAAYRLAQLVGIGRMVPASVERSWNGKDGAYTWWIDAMMDEEGRRKGEQKPPDADAFNRENYTMRVFTLLVYDTDRNQGNILITSDWKIVMIDFTRAFRAWGEELPAPLTIVRRCDRTLLAGMRALTKPAVSKAVGSYLTTWEVDSLLKRRDVIVRHLDDLVARLGDAAVLY